jgi:hypothetical protein
MSNTLHGMAKMGYSPGPAFLEAMTRAAMPRLPDANAQNIANMINAFGK